MKTLNEICQGPAESTGADKSSDSDLPRGDEDRMLTVGGCRRTYRLHLPMGFMPGERLPLVIMMHGGGMTGRQMERITGLSGTADRKHLVVAYPEAIGKFNGREHCWNDCRVPEVDDVAFITALIDELVSGVGVDTRRVYIAGYSNGACMTNRLGVELSDRIAAIAAVSGTIDAGMADHWQPKRPLPVLYFHGTADPFAYYDGGTAGTAPGASLSADQCVLWWAEKNGCAPEPSGEELRPDSAGLSVRHYVYCGGCSGAEVLFYRIEGGGHTWPGRPGVLSPEIFGKTAADLDANEIIWQFFKNRQLPANTRGKENHLLSRLSTVTS